MKKKAKLMEEESSSRNNDEIRKKKKEIDGGWKTLFYIDLEEIALENKPLLEFLERVTINNFENVTNKEYTKLGNSEESRYHISLSKMNNLAKHEIEPIVNKIRESLKQVCAGCFPVELQSSLLCVLNGGENDEICFGCLKIENQGNRELNAIVDQIDSVLQLYNKSQYFEERIFHISLCSWLFSFKTVGLNNNPKKEEEKEKMETFFFNVRHVTMKAGNLIYKIPFI